MNSRNLTRSQLEQLLERAEADLHYYARLKARMKEQGFPDDDKLWQLVDGVHDRVQHLRMWLHYRVDEGIKGTAPASPPASPQPPAG